MAITFKKANDLFKKSTNRWDGAKYYSYRIIIMNDAAYIFLGRNTILTINSLNEYTFYSKSASSVNFYRKHTPLKVKFIKRKWWCGYIPLYVGMRIDKYGNYMIPDVYGSDRFECQDCSTHYDEHRCPDCLLDERERLLDEAEMAYTNNGDSRW
jgi:hypothetical protein